MQKKTKKLSRLEIRMLFLSGWLIEIFDGVRAPYPRKKLAYIINAMRKEIKKLPETAVKEMKWRESYRQRLIQTLGSN